LISTAIPRFLVTNDPVLIAYSAKRSKDGKRTYWNRIGRAFPHQVGAGLTVVLDAMPVNGRIVLLEPNDHDYDREVGQIDTMKSDDGP